MALRWGYPPLLVERISWAGTVSFAREARAALCRAWNPCVGTLLDALRVAYLIALSTTSAVESTSFLRDTISSPEPKDGREVHDAIKLLVEAWREAGPEVLDRRWIQLAIAEPTYAPTLLPATIVASWVIRHRPDVTTIVDDQVVHHVTAWDGDDLAPSGSRTTPRTDTVLEVRKPARARAPGVSS